MCALRLRSGAPSTSSIILDAANVFVRSQQFILLIQQVQAPEDLATAPVPPRQTAPSSPINTTNTSPTGVLTYGQNTTAPLSSLPPSTPLQRPLRQEMTWFSVIRSVFRFIWYDEHNRICAPSTSRFSLPPPNGMNGTCRVLRIHRSHPCCTRHSCARICGGHSRRPLFVALGTADRACCAPWKAMCAGKELYRRNYRGTNVACAVYDGHPRLIGRSLTLT